MGHDGSCGRATSKLKIERVVTSLLLLGGTADQSTPHGQVTFDNRTSVSGEMYIDGSYRCRAPSQVSCTVQVETGSHVVEFRFTDGDLIRGVLELDAGEWRNVPVREVQLDNPTRRRLRSREQQEPLRRLFGTAGIYIQDRFI